MKKYWVFIVSLLFIGAIATSVINANSITNEKNKAEICSSPTIYNYLVDEGQQEQFFKTSIIFSSPEITTKINSIEINLKEETSQTLIPNKPMLPVVTKVYILPFKSKIKDLTVIFYDEQVKKLSKAICLAPESIPTGKITTLD